MNYEFHVGDYFETKMRTTGYITNYAKYFSHVAKADAIVLEGITTCGKEMLIDVVCNDLYKHFNRIGKYDFTTYDFTKKEKKKIARLSEDDSWLTFRNTNKANVNLCYIIKRINELVDAVNLLLDKSTES